MRKLLLAAACAALLAGPAYATVSMDWVPVENPGNPADSPTNCIAPGCGSVGYNYFISKYDVTNAQYAEFLNTVDPSGSNTLGLYDSAMSADASNGGITNTGSVGSVYQVKSGFANDPVVYVSFYDALRFANWLNNGQGSASTETGAYTLLGGTPVPSNGTSVMRNAGAITFLPSENEWYKAAYYNPVTSSYFAYPAGSSTPTTCAAPGPTPNTANCDLAVGHVTPVGAYTGSGSPYGTVDQGGDVFQWNEQSASGGSNRGLRGGAWFYSAFDIAASNPYESAPTGVGNDVGFRVASLVTSTIDTDGDGTPDAIDNCPFTPNGPLLGTCLGNFPQGQAVCHANSDCTSGRCSLNQEDTGGVGSGSLPDGIGDACQCGDVNNDGIVNNTDATLIKRAVTGLAPYAGGVTTLPGYNKCQVANGAPGLTCNNTQATIITRAVAGLAPGTQQGCHAATIFP